MALTIKDRRLQQLLFILTAVGTLALPSASRALDRPSAAMQAEFTSFCLDYYGREQCDNGFRFAAETYGSEYFVLQHNDEVPESFLERLKLAVQGGEALKAKGFASTQTRD